VGRGRSPLGSIGLRRVCHITTVHHADDARILHKECVSLRAAGYDVTLIAPHPEDTVIEGVAVVALREAARNRIHRWASRPLAAYRAAVAVDADLYHFHDPDFLPYGVRLARAGKRVVYDVHEDVPVQIRHKDYIPAPARAAIARAFAALEAACVARIDAVVGVNPEIAERLGRHQPLTAVVANYPRLDEIAPTSSWDERIPAAGYVGSITRVRGARELVDAMAHTDTELHLGGDIWPPELRTELEQSPGWERVRYLGRLERRRVAELLAGIKVGVIPLHPIENYVEAYPVKLFEYMAAGLPVVATDIPRWREVLEAHDCGVCVPHGSPEQLAAAITALLEDDDRARAMGERGRQAAVERYSWQTQADALTRLYAQLLD
jgi:glycosyltransferase involved in cell wall biosynthesis